MTAEGFKKAMLTFAAAVAVLVGGCKQQSQWVAPLREDPNRAAWIKQFDKVEQQLDDIEKKIKPFMTNPRYAELSRIERLTLYGQLQTFIGEFQVLQKQVGTTYLLMKAKKGAYPEELVNWFSETSGRLLQLGQMLADAQTELVESAKQR